MHPELNRTISFGFTSWSQICTSVNYIKSYVSFRHSMPQTRWWKKIYSFCIKES
jgi:hypothetical protein